ncbi:MAG TPA: hypothetical protein ENN58_02750 [bacterium]|nr:hypothetical protein [bacterium]
MTVIKLNTFVTGTDKWHIENMVDFDFLWHSHPFENSKSKGFILPEVKIKKGVGMALIIDVADVKDIEITALDLKKTIFYSESWNNHSSIYATVAKNIIAFHNNIPLKIKENYKML